MSEWPGFPVCRCGEARWQDVTDLHTGTAYMRCAACGRYRRASTRGYIDHEFGICMESTIGPGSAWTQRLSPRYFESEGT